MKEDKPGMKSVRETLFILMLVLVADVLISGKLRILCKAFSPSNICRCVPSLPLDV
jgi:hypothetical protein